MKKVSNTEPYLIFTIEAILFGIKTSRILKMIPFEQVKQDEIDLCWFHKKMNFHKKKVVYQTPMVLWIKEMQMPVGIVVDQPGDILKIFRNDIRPLPHFIRQYAGTAPIESVVLKGSSIILLMDIDHLIEDKKASKN